MKNFKTEAINHVTAKESKVNTQNNKQISKAQVPRLRKNTEEAYAVGACVQCTTTNKQEFWRYRYTSHLLNRRTPDMNRKNINSIKLL